MNKIFLSLVLFSAVAFAQTHSISDALCDLQNTAASLVAAANMICIIIAGPIILAGVALLLLKKDDKRMRLVGTVMIIGGIAIPVMLVAVYILIPVIISALMGGGTPVNC